MSLPSVAMVPEASSTRTARSTLLLVLGDLVHPSHDPAPTAAFVAALGLVGFERNAVRQALARAAKAGWIRTERRGRETWWSITDLGHDLIADGQRRTDGLARSRTDWDGSWVIVALSIPHARRAVRERVYRYLSWSGFGMPMPGVWVSPDVASAPGARFAIESFGLADSTLCLVGTRLDLGLDEAEIVRRAWDLDEIDTRYSALLSRYAARTPSTDAEALAAVLDIDADLRDLPALAPQLPPALAPSTRSRDGARALLEMRAAWLVPARREWERLVTT